MPPWLRLGGAPRRPGLPPGRDERRSVGCWLPRRGRDPSFGTAGQPTGQGAITIGFAGTPNRAENELNPARGGVQCEKSGGVLLSQGHSSQVPSALEGLTSVFGMGTGMTPPLSPPKPCCRCRSGRRSAGRNGGPRTRNELLENSIASTNTRIDTDRMNGETKPSAD